MQRLGAQLVTFWVFVALLEYYVLHSKTIGMVLLVVANPDRTKAMSARPVLFGLILVGSFTLQIFLIAKRR